MQVAEGENHVGVPSGIPVNLDMRVVRHGLVYVDNPDAIGEELANNLGQKVFALLLMFRNERAETATQYSEVQVGLVRGSSIDSGSGTPRYITPVTAKHNLARSDLKS